MIMKWNYIVCIIFALDFARGQTTLMGWNTIDTGYVEYTTPHTPGTTDVSIVSGGGVEQSQNMGGPTDSGTGNFYDWFPSGSNAPSFKYAMPTETTTERATTTTVFQPTTIRVQQKPHRQIFAAPKKMSFAAKMRHQKTMEVQSGISEKDRGSNGNWVQQKESKNQPFDPTRKPQRKSEWVDKTNEKRSHSQPSRRQNGGWRTIQTDKTEKTSSQPRHQAQSFKDLKIDVTKTSGNQFNIKLNKHTKKENENGFTRSSTSNRNGQRIVTASVSQSQVTKPPSSYFEDVPNNPLEEQHHSGIDHNKRTTFQPAKDQANYHPSASGWKVMNSDRNQPNKYKKENIHQNQTPRQAAFPEWQSASYNSRNQQQINRQPERSQILSQPVVRERVPSRMDREQPYSSPQQPEVRPSIASKMESRPPYSSSQQQSRDQPQSPFLNQNDNFKKQPHQNNNYVEQPPQNNNYVEQPPQNNYNKHNQPPKSNDYRRRPPQASNDLRQSSYQYDNIVRQISTLLEQQQILQKQHQDWQKNQLNIQKRQQQLQRENFGAMKKFTSAVDGIIPILKRVDKGIKKMHTMMGNFLAAV